MEKIILTSGLERIGTYMETEIDNEGNRTVYINSGDACIYCEQQYGCPLIECLSNGLVVQDERIDVIDCQHFKMLDR
jgi:hypothetical protein